MSTRRGRGRRAIVGAAAVVVMVGVMVGLTPAAEAATITVGPGQSIQAAIDAAPSGSTIIVRPGVYRETLAIVKDGISLVGAGPANTILESPGVPAGACAEFGGAIGVCVLGEVDFATSRVVDPVSSVRVSGFTIRNYRAFGALVLGGAGVSLADNRFEDNVEYGVYVNNSTAVQVVNNTATGSEEAGIYVGDSPTAATAIRNNQVSDNAIGIFVRASSIGQVRDNNAHGNCLGIFLLGAPDRTTRWMVIGNQVNQNSKACPPRGPAPARSGAGIVLINAHVNAISGNTVNGNVPTGPSAYSGGIVLLAGTGNHVTANVARGNRPADIMNVAGPTNTVAGNACGTSIPPGFC